MREKGGAAQKTSSDAYYTKPFIDDAKEIDRICKSESATRSRVVRALLREALRARRLRTIGRDASAAGIRDVYKEVLRAELTPIIAMLEEDKRVRERHTALLDDTHEHVLEAHEMTRQAWRDSHRIVDLLWANFVEKQFRSTRPGMTQDELADIRDQEDAEWERRNLALLDELRTAISEMRL